MLEFAVNAWSYVLASFSGARKDGVFSWIIKSTAGESNSVEATTLWQEEAVLSKKSWMNCDFPYIKENLGYYSSPDVHLHSH